MSPKPFTENNPHEYDQNASDANPDHRLVETRMSWRGPLVGVAIMLITILMILGVLWIAFSPNAARARTPKPQPAPAALLRARAACPDRSVTCLLGALRKAYAAVEWGKHERLTLAREMVGNVTNWQCIHRGEGAWNATGFYHGGLQMDWTFMRSYGRDMLRRHHGVGAEAWTPREQIIVAQRAFVQGRGYAPWPQTSHACGLR